MGDFVTCPYNPQHRMLKLRLQNHIVKCQKNYNTAGMKPCPYNATHIIALQEYKTHILTCPDSVLIEGHKYKDDGVHGRLNQGLFHFDISKDVDWETTDDVTDNSSVVSGNSSKDCSQDFDQFADYDEDDEPLQRYFFEEKKSERLRNASASGSTGNNEEADSVREKHPSTDDFENSRAGKLVFQCGGGRGKLFRILAALNAPDAPSCQK